MRFKPYPYQDHGIKHVQDNPNCGLFLDMGLGKTVITLTAISELIDQFMVDKVLVIAPKRVAESVWSQEALKWDHLKHLTFCHVLGSEKARTTALRNKAIIYVINRENVAWLVNQYKSAFPFDTVVIDELSSFKSAQSVRFKSLRMVRPRVKRVIGLTGTPSPNGLIDLWPQLYLLDQGERLGKTITGYRERYFSPEKMSGHVVYSYRIKKTSEEEIYSKIGDICISMKASDYLELPKRVDNFITTQLSKENQKKYDDFEESQVLALQDAEISALNAAALTNKLLQFANGAIYDDEHNWHEVHDQKLNTLAEIVEAAQGKPVLVFYSYKHDLERILKSFNARKLETDQDIQDWNQGKIEVMVTHPASSGHGLNLQAGGNIIVWFGLTWSLELYMQANARLDRQGQTKPVVVNHIIAANTMDVDVMEAIKRKASGQNALLEAVKARIEKYHTFTT